MSFIDKKDFIFIGGKYGILTLKKKVICFIYIYIIKFPYDILLKVVNKLTPKRQSPFFGPFLKFGQTIVNAILVQKMSNFW